MNKLRLIILALIFILSINQVFGQNLSKLSEKIKADYESLKKDPDSEHNRLVYLKDFPQNKQKFIEVFAPSNYGQLYNDSHEYIEAFVALAKYYPVKVIDKAINIGKDLTYDADAIGELQIGIVNLGDQHTRLFVNKLKSLPKQQTNKLVAFLADVEDHKSYYPYQQLIDLLKKAREKGLADKFIRARTLREKLPNH